MGTVYLGYDKALRRLVAVKVLPVDRMDASSRTHFRQEALVLSRLNHPNIAAMYEYGREDGADYLVMEHVEGQTVKELIAPGPRPGAQVAALGAQLSRGLDAAHAAGIVHRDIKPANLCVTSQDVLKILDFGVAIPPPASSMDLTMSGARSLPTLAGTLHYMSPERLRGARADARTDIFSAGVVLYEMACGLLKPRTLEEIQSGTLRPPREIAPQVDRALERIILRAVASDPERRYQHAADLAADLDDLGPPMRLRDSGLSARAVEFAREALRFTGWMFFSGRARAAARVERGMLGPRTRGPAWIGVPSSQPRPPRPFTPRAR